VVNLNDILCERVVALEREVQLDERVKGTNIV
jgi:hypothetical protein